MAEGICRTCDQPARLLVGECRACYQYRYRGKGKRSRDELLAARERERWEQERYRRWVRRLVIRFEQAS